MKSKNKRPARVAVQKGYGPRHAENAKEGDLTKVNTDTVPAMLTPREAVLNRNAAELAGRGNIEQLNEEGNVLAKKGVDLAAGGESDVGLSDILKTYQAGGDLTPAEIARVIAVLRGGTGGEPEPGAATAVPKYGQYHEDKPELQNPNRAKGVASVAVMKPPKAVTDNLLKYVLPGAVRREATAGIPKGVQKGTSDMKSKPKSSKPKGYAGGSPYAQGYQKLQGGGNVPFEPQGLKQGQMNYWNRYGQLPPGLGGPPPPEAPFSGGTPQGGQPQPVQQPYGAQPVGSGAIRGMGSLPNPVGNKGWGEGVDQAKVASGALPGEPYRGPAIGGGGFYPRGQAFASGSQDVPGGIGAPNTSTAYSKDQVDFKAPDLSGFLKAIQEEAQKRGISPAQMSQIAQQFSGMANRGGVDPNAGGNFGPVTDVSSQPYGLSGYQGGISDIGYPPMLMPNATYHADKGSTWEGPYDPEYLVQRYAGGTSQVPGYQEGVTRSPHFQGSISPIDWSDLGWAGSRPSGFMSRGLNPAGSQFGFGGFGYSPPAGTPGFLQGPTLHPSTFDAQGYPYPQPVGQDFNTAGGTRGLPPKRTS